MLKRCDTCGLPLWISWILMGRPWRKRIRAFREAHNCTELLEIEEK